MKPKDRTLFDPVDRHVRGRDVDRLTRSNERLLAALRTGPKTNVELVPICGMRVSGRVFDLRRHGYAIKATAGTGGVWTYELEDEAGLAMLPKENRR